MHTQKYAQFRFCFRVMDAAGRRKLYDIISLFAALKPGFGADPHRRPLHFMKVQLVLCLHYRGKSRKGLLHFYRLTLPCLVCS